MKGALILSRGQADDGYLIDLVKPVMLRWRCVCSIKTPKYADSMIVEGKSMPCRMAHLAV